MACPWILTFNQLLSKTTFSHDMKDLLQTLQSAYGSPVDIEFTANFLDETNYRINLLQCRTFQLTGQNVAFKEIPIDIAEEDLVLETSGPIIGNGRSIILDRIIYIVPEIYGKLPMQDRYSIAHIIGKIMHINYREEQTKYNIMILGPGRWGTSSPELGIPVTFSEINTVSVIGEIAEMHEGLIPDVSLGTHFFNDIVELDMLYFAIHPERQQNKINREIFELLPNLLSDLLSEAEKWSSVIKLIDLEYSGAVQRIKLTMNPITQQGSCYLINKPESIEKN
jgi:hypothetical protein